ncbi:hypothetical protein SCWH03_33290 [Streptomyces pacificus]|uniref:Uncharacterized protein n=1 Tax=Streptomyces pacificus TaxID=2705029 RepID=A0A6A0AXE3_9ACTN|nr:hypothetical protein SCWH03_33290 [Streptomyces pacificus]
MASHSGQIRKAVRVASVPGMGVLPEGGVDGARARAAYRPVRTLWRDRAHTPGPPGPSRPRSPALPDAPATDRPGTGATRPGPAATRPDGAVDGAHQESYCSA